MKRILVLDGHPAKTSISHQIIEKYSDSARKQGHEIRLLRLSDLSFDMDYGYGGYKTQKPLEPDLEEFLTALEWCEHFVLATPMWWGGLPAKLKGLIDRSFLPGRTFDTRGGGLPKPLLAGRTAQIILTSDSPWWYFRLLHRPLFWQLKKQIFGFVGFNPVRIHHFTGASHPTSAQIERWFSKAQMLGAKAA